MGSSERKKNTIVIESLSPEKIGRKWTVMG